MCTVAPLVPHRSLLKGHTHLFEANHHLSGQLHVFEHSLQLTSKVSTTLCTIGTYMYMHIYNVHALGIHGRYLKLLHALLT